MAEHETGRVQHKHADVLRAIADGKAVQVWSNCYDEWLDHVSIQDSNPLTKPNWVWRVKPEKKKVWINIYPLTCHFHESKELARKHSHGGRIACVEIEYEEGEGL